MLFHQNIGDEEAGKDKEHVDAEVTSLGPSKYKLVVVMLVKAFTPVRAENNAVQGEDPDDGDCAHSIKLSEGVWPALEYSK